MVLGYAHIARRSRFVVNEISRNKVVVPEGAAGLGLKKFRSFLSVEFSFTLNCYVVQFDMIWFCWLSCLMLIV